LSIIIGTHKERGGKLSRDHFSAHELRRAQIMKQKEPLPLALACAPLLFNSFCLASPILSSHVPAQVSVSLENPDRKVSISLKKKNLIETANLH
jgi:hypothetical protein